jgi:hypothetical protein
MSHPDPLYDDYNDFHDDDDRKNHFDDFGMIRQSSMKTTTMIAWMATTILRWNRPVGERMRITVISAERTTSPKALPHKTLRRGGPHRFDVNSYLLMTYSKKYFFKKTY